MNLNPFHLDGNEFFNSHPPRSIAIILVQSQLLVCHGHHVNNGEEMYIKLERFDEIEKVKFNRPKNKGDHNNISTRTENEPRKASANFGNMACSSLSLRIMKESS